eukprot:3647218-Pyramimonas_sp.AAC.1
MWTVKLEPGHQRVREVLAVAASPIAAQRDVGGEAGARRQELWHPDQCTREGRAVAAGPIAAQAGGAA